MKTTILSTLNFLKPVLIGGVAIGLVGGTALVAINSTPQEEAPSITDEPTMGEVVEEPSEDNPAIAEGDIPARGEVGAEEVPAIKPSTTTKPSAPTTQETIVYSILGHKKLHKKEGWVNLFDDNGVQYNIDGSFTNIWDFEEAANGMCPQDIPTGAWPDALRPGVALGIIHSAYGSKDPLAHADEIWSQMKGGVASISDGGFWLFAKDLGLDFTTKPENCNLLIAFTLSWSQRTVGWTDLNGASKATISQDIVEQMDSIANQMTSRIRQRDSQFKTKCGY